MPADIVSAETRSRMMSGIRGKNTKPEMMVRSALHQRGFRFRLHRRDLAGRPDLVFPRYNAVLFVNGCFWHGHDCHLFRWPKSREDFWRTKISTNIQRDVAQHRELMEAGWRVGVVWECALKGKIRKPLNVVADQCSIWLKSEEMTFEVSGHEERPAI